MRAMKQTRVIRWQACGVWLAVAAAGTGGAQTPPPSAMTPAPADAMSAAPSAVPSADQTSYLFGLTFGEQLHRVGITDQLTIDAVTQGLKDGLSGKKSTPADQQQLNVFVQSVMQTALARNRAAAKDFLEKNAQEKGVTRTASGLEYKVLLPGDRKAPAINPTDEVTVQYRGKLLDGSEFDSTYSGGAPASFRVNGVIPGWQEALVLMKPGAKWQLFVPPELGYNSSARPGIPAGSLLIFEVELISVKPSGAAGAPADTKPAPKAH